MIYIHKLTDGLSSNLPRHYIFVSIVGLDITMVAC
jgi:hypothetical protein